MWIQVDLGKRYTISKIETKGKLSLPLYIGWVKSYEFEYSVDGQNWEFYVDENGTRHLLPGNTDATSVATNVLENPVSARYARVHVKEYYNWPLLQFELYGILSTQ